MHIQASTKGFYWIVAAATGIGIIVVTVLNAATPSEFVVADLAVGGGLNRYFCKGLWQGDTWLHRGIDFCFLYFSGCTQ